MWRWRKTCEVSNHCTINLSLHSLDNNKKNSNSDIPTTPHQILLHLLWHKEIPFYHHTPLHGQTSSNYPNICASTIWSLISFGLDNSYFEFNGTSIHKTLEPQWDTPLEVELTEIRVADVKDTALTAYTGRPNTCWYFVHDEIGDFPDKSLADGFVDFLNSITWRVMCRLARIQLTTYNTHYTIEYPEDGTLPYKTSPHHMLPNTYKLNWTRSTQRTPLDSRQSEKYHAGV